MNRYILSIFMLVSSFGLACKKPTASASLNVAEISKLMEIANNHSINTDEKYFTLVESYAQVLQDALTKATDEEMKQQLSTYRNQNEDALVRLEEEFDTWQKNMTDEERMYFVVNLVSKPTTQRLNYLVPKVEQRMAKYSEDYKELKRMLMRLDLRR